MWSQKAQTQTAHRGECSSFGATEQENHRIYCHLLVWPWSGMKVAVAAEICKQTCPKIGTRNMKVIRAMCSHVLRLKSWRNFQAAAVPNKISAVPQPFQKQQGCSRTRAAPKTRQEVITLCRRIWASLIMSKDLDSFLLHQVPPLWHLSSSRRPLWSWPPEPGLPCSGSQSYPTTGFVLPLTGQPPCDNSKTLKLPIVMVFYHFLACFQWFLKLAMTKIKWI